MRTLLPLVTAAVLASSPVFAQEFYGQILGGATNFSDLSFDGEIGALGNQDVETDQDTGFNVTIAIGTALPALGDSFRGELELSYGESDVDSVDFSGNGAGDEPNVDGDIATTRLFANILYDFDQYGKFTPYVGAGLGAAFTNVDFSYGGGVNLDDTSVDFTSQLILGSAYELTDALSLVGDIRYIRDFNVSSDRFNGAGALTGTVEDDVETVSLNLGLRLNF